MKAGKEYNPDRGDIVWLEFNPHLPGSIIKK